MRLIALACALALTAPALARADETDLVDVEDANVHMSSIEVDGVVLHDLACRMKSGALLTLILGPALAKAIGPKRARLRACVTPDDVTLRFRYTQEGKRTTDVSTGQGAKKDRCVAQALHTLPAIADGTCALTVQLR